MDGDNTNVPNLKQLNSILDPEFSKYIFSFITNKDQMQRNILFQNVKATAEKLLSNNVVKPLVLYYMVTTINMAKAVHGVELAPIRNDILKMIKLVYPDDNDYANKIASQIIVMSLLLTQKAAEIPENMELLKDVIKTTGFAGNASGNL